MVYAIFVQRLYSIDATTFLNDVIETRRKREESLEGFGSSEQQKSLRRRSMSEAALEKAVVDGEVADSEKVLLEKDDGVGVISEHDSVDVDDNVLLWSFPEIFLSFVVSFWERYGKFGIEILFPN